jgi:hypothetical protein
VKRINICGCLHLNKIQVTSPLCNLVSI